MEENLFERIQVDINIKYMYQIQDKMFKPNEVVVYAQRHSAETEQGFETWAKVVTVNEHGDATTHLKDLTPVTSTWY